MGHGTTATIGTIGARAQEAASALPHLHPAHTERVLGEIAVKVERTWRKKIYFVNIFLFVKVSKLNFAANSKSICLKEIAICFRNLVAVFIDGRKNPLSDV